MPINMPFNPFTVAIECAEALWPDLDCDIVFAESIENEDGSKHECFGMTEFHDDGERPTVVVLATMPLQGVVEVLCHELAHVATPHDEDHGEVWQAAFDAIHKEYVRRVQGDDGEGG